jgi:hypothetical protein
MCALFCQDVLTRYVLLYVLTHYVMIYVVTRNVLLYMVTRYVLLYMVTCYVLLYMVTRNILLYVVTRYVLLLIFYSIALYPTNILYYDLLQYRINTILNFFVTCVNPTIFMKDIRYILHVTLAVVSFAGCCECSNEPSGSTKSGEFLD